MAELKVPGGKLKGQPIADADDDTIRYWFNRLSKDLADNPQKQWGDRDRSWLAGAAALMIERGYSAEDFPLNGSAGPESSGSAPRPDQRPPAHGAQAKAGPSAVRQSTQTFHDPKQLAEAIEKISANYNLVGVVSVGAFPIGHEVVMTVIPVPPTGFFKTEQGQGLSGNSISMIADAAGVSVVESIQTGYDPRGFASHRVTVARQELSGGVRAKMFNGQLDLRPGTSQYDELLRAGQARVAKAKAKNWDNIPDEKGQIRAKLQHLPALAETKSYLRAVRKLLSLDRSYTELEARKPFAVFRLSLTGRDPNPRIEMMIAKEFTRAALGGLATLYGNNQARQLGSGGPPPPQLPAGQVVDMEDDEEQDSEPEPPDDFPGVDPYPEDY